MAEPGAFLDPANWSPWEAAALRQRRGVVSPGRADTTIDQSLTNLLMGSFMPSAANAMDLSQLPESRNVQVVPETQRFVGPTPTQLYDYHNMPVNQTPPMNDLATMLGLLDIPQAPWPQRLGTRP